MDGWNILLFFRKGCLTLLLTKTTQSDRTKKIELALVNLKQYLKRKENEPSSQSGSPLVKKFLKRCFT